jgi:hypothetical protein
MYWCSAQKHKKVSPVEGYQEKDPYFNIIVLQNGGREKFIQKGFIYL